MIKAASQRYNTLSNTNTHIYICTVETPTQRTVTFEGLVELALPENDAEVVDGAGVELHPEHHVSGRVPEPLVVTLQLR